MSAPLRPRRDDFGATPNKGGESHAPCEMGIGGSRLGQSRVLCAQSPQCRATASLGGPNGPILLGLSASAAALERAGIVFLEKDHTGGVGVRLKK
jgi:hypothetical protein